MQRKNLLLFEEPYMKTLLSTLVMLTSLQLAAAESFTATVKDTTCAEIDPFVVGDRCLVQLEKTSKERLTLVIDFDEFQATYEENELAGKLVTVDGNKLKKIMDHEVLDVLNDFTKTRYVYATTDALNVKRTTQNEGMRPLVEGYRGFFNVKSLPAGYKAEEIKEFPFAANFETYLARATAQKRKDWRNHVMTSGEYDNLSRAELLQTAARPNETLGVTHLLSVSEAYKIYNSKGVLVGYFVEMADHVQATIYQDGAWINMFLDAEQNVIKAFDESA
jgi:hypothetical protein